MNEKDLQKLLDYDDWRNFVNVMEKAKISCKNAGQRIEDHFVDVNKMVQLGSGSKREIDDFMLTSAHNKDWHAGRCDKCFDKMMEAD